MSDTELKQYFFINRQDREAFQTYLERSIRLPKSVIAKPNDPDIDLLHYFSCVSQLRTDK